MQQHTFSFDAPEPIRLDRYLAAVLPDLSRSMIRKLVDDGLVTVEGAPAKASRTLRGGEAVVVRIPPAGPLEVEPEDIPLDVLYEDSDIIVVNKPAGMVVHPAPGHDSGTLVNSLLAHCRDLSGIGGVLRPGIVHRLDAGTTGVIIVAKNDTAHAGLSEQFAARTVEKTYRAIVFGRVEPPLGEIDLPIGRDRRDRKKISPRSDLAREALTSYEAVARWSEFSLLNVRIHTGRTHQIRVHLADIQHPIIGDELYAGRRWRGVNNQQMAKKAKNFGRPALHAWRLAIVHPRSGETMQFEAPEPRDMATFIRMLGEPT